MPLPSLDPWMLGLFPADLIQEFRPGIALQQTGFSARILQNAIGPAFRPPFRKRPFILDSFPLETPGRFPVSRG